MAENEDPTTGPGEAAAQPEEPTVEQTAVTNQAAPVEPETTKFTERLWNFRAMAAVALAALLLGGGLGAAITAASHDDGRDRHLRIARWGDGPGGPFMGPGGPGVPGGYGPGDRQQFRQDTRQERRQRMKERFQYDGNAPKVPSPPTPSPTKNG